MHRLNVGVLLTCTLQGIKMEESFGFAPSTLVYKASKPKM